MQRRADQRAGDGPSSDMQRDDHFAVNWPFFLFDSNWPFFLFDSTHDGSAAERTANTSIPSSAGVEQTKRADAKA
jgi:hypothetical protein